MKAWELGCALSIGGALALLVGCGGSQPPIGTPGAMLQTSAIATHAGRGRSWMLPEAKNSDLLYISTSAGTVDVYDYNSRIQVGSLTGFENPGGECVDKTGDIWITNSDASNVLEYAHGGTTPMQTINTNGHPFGCSVDANGDLALAVTPNGNVSKIQIFKVGSLNGAIYHDTHCDPLWTPGYDINGNLSFEGEQLSQYSYKINVCELPAGSTSVRRVEFNKKIRGLGGIMWDGKYVTLVDTTNGIHTAIYQATEGLFGKLTLVGTTQLTDTACNDTTIRQIFIVGKYNTPINNAQGHQVLGGNQTCYNDFDGWSYPQGKYKWALSLRFGQGETVSLAPRQ